MYYYYAYDHYINLKIIKKYLLTFSLFDVSLYKLKIEQKMVKTITHRMHVECPIRVKTCPQYSHTTLREKLHSETVARQNIIIFFTNT